MSAPTATADGRIGIYGDTHFECIPTWEAALRVAREAGHEVADARVQPITHRDCWSGELKPKGYVHVHLFSPQGVEIGYWTAFVNMLTVFRTPRTWDGGTLAATKAPDECPTLQC